MAKATKSEVDASSVPVEGKVEKATAHKPTTLTDVFTGLYNGYGEHGTDVGKKEFSTSLSKYLTEQLLSKYPDYKKYNLIFLFDNNTMVKSDADKIYNAVTKFSVKKPLLLILLSRGGVAGSAYLIGKLCREYCNDKFTIVVPRYAKSAATLICCAADEIHMGSLSELGPIDPQIDDMPALGLKNAIEHIAQLVKDNPSSSEMFAKYLKYSVEPISLGYYERVAESAMQYAEKLLLTHAAHLPKTAKNIANDLVYKYKDHGFVIDKAEAEEIFGKEIIKMNTTEYEIGNFVYRTLDFIRTLADGLGYVFYYIGSLETEPSLIAKKK